MKLTRRPAASSKGFLKLGRSRAPAAAALVVLFSFAGGIAFRGHPAYKELRNWAGIRSKPEYWKAVLHSEPLPLIFVDMKFKHYNQILIKREEALKIGLLFASSLDFVPATIRAEGVTIPVKMRLKGVLPDHFSGDSWSFRVKTKNGRQLYGMKRFSLQRPPTRHYVHEWGFLEHLRIEGVLAPRYLFVRLILNGTAKGIYAVEEAFAKQLIESQGRRDSVLLKWDDSRELARWGQLGAPDMSTMLTVLDGSGMHPMDFERRVPSTYAPGDVTQNISLRSFLQQAYGMLRGFQQGTLRPSDAFDAVLLGRFLAITELWQARHGIYAGNMVHYYNPFTKKLEPVGFDAVPPIHPTLRDFYGRLVALEEDWSRKCLRDSRISKHYVSQLQRLSKPEYLKDLREKIGPQFGKYTAALHREWPWLKEPWPDLENRQSYIKKLLSPTEFLQAFQIPGGPQNMKERAFYFEIANLFDLPVEIIGFQTDGGHFVDAHQALADSTLLSKPSPDIALTDEKGIILLPNERKKSLEYLNFRIAHDKIGHGKNAKTPSFTVRTRLVGSDEEKTQPVRYFPEAAARTQERTIEATLAAHPYLKLQHDPPLFIIKRGRWKVAKDLVLPFGIGLFAGPGVSLEFERDILLETNASIRFIGTETNPVTLTAANDTWEGMIVANAAAESVLEHTAVMNTRGVKRNNYLLTGGVTFYRSPIFIKKSRFTRSSAEDAVNIVNTAFQIDDSIFESSGSDALDADFAHGTITGTVFNNIGSDAVDVSGSELVLQDITLRNIGDKCVSVGEQSSAAISNLYCANAKMGVASKDRSTVNISSSTITDYSVAGLAAFEKKAEYGPAEIIANDVSLGQNRKALLIQKGSWIRRDYIFFKGKDVDVNALYEQKGTP